MSASNALFKLLCPKDPKGTATEYTLTREDLEDLLEVHAEEARREAAEFWFCDGARERLEEYEDWA